MSMPKATIYKNHCAIFLENNIRFSWKAFRMYAKPITFPEQCFANNDFRICIFPLYSGHHPASGGLVNNVYHVGSGSLFCLNVVTLLNRQHMWFHYSGYFLNYRNYNSVAKLLVSLGI